MDSSLLIAHNSLRYLNDDLFKLGFTEKVRAGLYGMANLGKSGNDAISTRPSQKGFENIPVTTVIFDSAFDNPSNPFDEMMPHEAIHRSDIGFNWNWKSYTLGLWKTHDLEGYANYQDIIDSCKPPQ